MEELTMTVSPVCTKNGEKLAYVSFEDTARRAEGVIPECRIISNTGFTEEEVGQLELYLKMNLGELKKQAASVNAVSAMMKNSEAFERELRERKSTKL